MRREKYVVWWDRPTLQWEGEDTFHHSFSDLLSMEDWWNTYNSALHSRAHDNIAHVLTIDEAREFDKMSKL